jgi:hypothetical protein
MRHPSHHRPSSRRVNVWRQYAMTMDASEDAFQQSGIRFGPRYGDAFGATLLACYEAGGVPGVVQSPIERDDGCPAPDPALDPAHLACLVAMPPVVGRRRPRRSHRGSRHPALSGSARSVPVCTAAVGCTPRRVEWMGRQDYNRASLKERTMNTASVRSAEHAALRAQMPDMTFTALVTQRAVYAAVKLDIVERASASGSTSSKG